MRTIIHPIWFVLCSLNMAVAQDRTTVIATNSEISDNLDLRAIASIFGDSQNLEDFEYRLNNPEVPISNLDLNEDNQVDYLRVVESVEGRTHLIVIQSVIGLDQYQDVATLEVEKDRQNNVQVQIVGNTFLYGPNYIYEPVYAFTPVIYSHFWVSGYRPYCSTWYWGYYPSYYWAWQPFPIFRYRNHINICINVHHQYHYVNYRRSQVAYHLYHNRRCNAFEIRHPHRSFTQRNTGITNRHDLDQTRIIRTPSPRGNFATNHNQGGRIQAVSRQETSRNTLQTTRNNGNLSAWNSRNDPRGNRVETNTIPTTKPYVTTRTNSWNATKNESIRSNSTVRNQLHTSQEIASNYENPPASPTRHTQVNAKPSMPRTGVSPMRNSVERERPNRVTERNLSTSSQKEPIHNDTRRTVRQPQPSNSESQIPRGTERNRTSLR